MPHLFAVEPTAITADNFGGKYAESAVRASKLFAPCDFNLNHIELGGGDNGRVAVLHVVLRNLALVDLHCFREKVCSKGLLKQGITLVLFVCEDAQFGLTTSDTELIDESVTVDYDCSNSDNVPHTWADATCDAPKTCSVCGKIEGEALGHNWVDATTEAPKTCSVCGKTEGDKLPETPGEDNPPIEDNNPDADEIPEEDNTDNEENCEKDHSKCLEEASGFKRFLNAIGNFFRGIFSKYVKCVCGDEILKDEYSEFKKIFKQNK